MAEGSRFRLRASKGAGTDSQLEGLVGIYRQLAREDRQALMRLARTLHARSNAHAAPASAARPGHHETVVQAIRRLMRAYPDLDRAKLLGETSRCLAQHMVDGREAAEVIGELEVIFASARSRFRDHSRRRT